tara:strand:- start:6 stop:371 length:366 start_codon:yes stop_codon:yes gene_type:complete
MGKSSESTLSNLLKDGTINPAIVARTMKETATEKVVRTFVSSIIQPPISGERGMKIKEPIASREFTLPLRCWSTLSDIVVLQITPRVPPMMPSIRTKNRINKNGIGIAHISIHHAIPPIRM